MPTTLDDEVLRITWHEVSVEVEEREEKGLEMKAGLL